MREYRALMGGTLESSTKSKGVYMGIIVFLFVLIFLNSLCFGQVHQSGTKRIMIKGQWVDTPVFTTGSEDKTYYDAHPEEKALDPATQANKPLADMQEKLIEDIRRIEQGAAGSVRDSSLPRASAVPPPPSPPPAIPSTPGVLIQRPNGAIHSGTGDFYPKSGRGLIDPKTGGFLPDVGGGYIDPSTGTFIPKK
ncbi:MAG: hypothetical protein ABSH06_00390 [Thermodesulfobacteriota bacterium]